MTETCGHRPGARHPHVSRAPLARPPVSTTVRLDPATGGFWCGTNVLAGYLNLLRKTAETIDADGWLHTGDVGTVDDEGFFRITDRAKDIIITAGGRTLRPANWKTSQFSPTSPMPWSSATSRLPHGHHRDRPGERGEFAQDADIPFSNYASLTRALKCKN